MKSALIASLVVMTVATAGCAASTTTPDDQGGDDAVATDAAVPSTDERGGGIKVRAYVPCSDSQWDIAEAHSMTKRGFGYNVTGCNYNTSTGYIVYTYVSAVPQDVCPLCPFGP
jgi:hypothetical protein